MLNKLLFVFLLQTKHPSAPTVWRRSVCATCSCRFYILCSRIHSGRQPFINYDKYRLVFSILKAFPLRLLLISLVGKKTPRSELDLEEFIVWLLWKIKVHHLVIDEPLLVTRKPEKVKNYKWRGKSDSSESFLPFETWSSCVHWASVCGCLTWLLFWLPGRAELGFNSVGSSSAPSTVPACWNLCKRFDLGRRAVKGGSQICRVTDSSAGRLKTAT